MLNAIHYKADPTTLVADAAASQLCLSGVFADVSVPYERVPTHVTLLAENPSLTTNAVLTVKLQAQMDGGNWEDLETRQAALRGAVGLVVADRVTVTCFGLPLYTGDNVGSVRVRLIASCTGGNVNIVSGEMLCMDRVPV